MSITLDRGLKELNHAALRAEEVALIKENSKDTYVGIYTDELVVCHHRSYWAFIALACGTAVQEASRAVSVTASSMTMEIKAVARAFRWLESQYFTHACLLSDGMTMIRNVQIFLGANAWIQSNSK